MGKYTSKLQGKRVLVIGGTSGIGFCVAEAAVEHGAKVIIASSQQSKVDATIKKLLEEYPGADVTGQACDIGTPETTDENQRLLLEFATKDGKLDHIVNTAAGQTHIGGLDEITSERFYRANHIKIVAPALIAKHVKNYMNVDKNSSITFTGGVNTFKPGPGWSLGAAGGSGLQGLVKALAVDLKPIRVNMVAPGAIVTELWERLFPDLEKTKELFSERSLVGGLGSPEDTAEAYIYFMKDRFMTGQHVLEDGGWTLI